MGNGKKYVVMDGEYKIITNVYSDNCECSAIGASFVEFINNGDNVVVVSNVRILPFDSWAPVDPVSGHLDTTQYDVRFELPSDFCYLVMVRKYMVKQ